jgi:3-isopropylmalate/(R)-2-methylmalate dehydratase small subunit
MDAFTSLTAVAVPMDLPNIDTDRIIPARFLRKPRGPGYEVFLFHDVRFDETGAERIDFVLNQPAFRSARILVAAENFACGSSREAAVWALMAHGFRAFIAPSFGDIFFENCGKNGALAVVLPAETVSGLRRQLHERPGASMSVDLVAQVVTGPDGTRHAFDVDPFRKHCLLRGIDEIALTLEHEAAIAAFEAARERDMPWLSAGPGATGGRSHGAP